MKSKIQFFPIMMLVVIVVFGFKSYDFAMGLDNKKMQNDIAAQLNEIATAAGQEDAAHGEETISDAPEPAADFDQGGFPYTGEEIQLLQKLSERREELDQRSRNMDVREKLLIATENGIDKKIESLKSIEAQIRALMELHDAQERAQIDSLVKTYSAMKPKDAAKIFNTLDMDILISIIEQMNPKIVAKVLPAMNTSSANNITVELATRKRLPEIEG
ncbi:MAG: hypothetical protein JKY84_01975 [Emcibacteraceae bacterium]|nr:hypothetical protein [Emcibacteraceae bacterium]